MPNERGCEQQINSQGQRAEVVSIFGQGPNDRLLARLIAKGMEDSECISELPEEQRKRAEELLAQGHSATVALEMVTERFAA